MAPGAPEEGSDTGTGGSSDDVDGHRGSVLGLTSTTAIHRFPHHGSIMTRLVIA
jgi:hypothetical protein